METKPSAPGMPRPSLSGDTPRVARIYRSRLTVALQQLPSSRLSLWRDVAVTSDRHGPGARLSDAGCAADVPVVLQARDHPRGLARRVWGADHDPLEADHEPLDLPQGIAGDAVDGLWMLLAARERAQLVARGGVKSGQVGVRSVF